MTSQVHVCDCAYQALLLYYIKHMKAVNINIMDCGQLEVPSL